MIEVSLSTDRHESPLEQRGNPLESLFHSSHVRQRVAATAASNFAVRSLPDVLFNDHPEVRQLRVFLRIEEHRAKGATMDLAHSVGSVIPTLEAKQKALRESLEMAALDNALAEDFEFSGAVAILEEIQHLDMQIKAARLAFGLLGKSPLEKGAFFRSRVHSAHDALNTRLLSLKQAHYAQELDATQRQSAGDPQVSTVSDTAEQMGGEHDDA